MTDSFHFRQALHHLQKPRSFAKFRRPKVRNGFDRSLSNRIPPFDSQHGSRDLNQGSEDNLKEGSIERAFGSARNPIKEVEAPFDFEFKPDMIIKSIEGGKSRYQPRIRAELNSSESLSDNNQIGDIKIPLVFDELNEKSTGLDCINMTLAHQTLTNSNNWNGFDAVNL